MACASALPPARTVGIVPDWLALRGLGLLLAAVLLVLADRRRPGLDQSALPWLGYVVVHLNRRLALVAVFLVGCAAAAGIAVWLIAGGGFDWVWLFLCVGWAGLACVVIFVLARVVIVGGFRAGIAQRQLDRLCAAYRCEAAYSAFLRDLSQAAYAVCATGSLPAEARIDRVRELLDEALGEPPPKPREALLAAVFGSERASASSPGVGARGG